MRARHRTLTLRTALALAAAFACVLLFQPARADDATPSNPEVRVTTNMGDFVIELLPDRAPLTVANFLRYVKEGFYYQHPDPSRGRQFRHPGWRPLATPPYDLKPTYPPIDNESGNGLQNKRGTVGLARAAGAAFGQRPVLHQPGRQPGPRPPAHPLGLRGLRPGRAGNGRRRPHRRRRRRAPSAPSSPMRR